MNVLLNIKKYFSEDQQILRKIDVKKTLPFPYMVVNKKKVIYYNENFEKVFSTRKAESILKKVSLKASNQILKIENENYFVYVVKNKDVSQIYFIKDMYHLINEEAKRGQIAIGYVFIDNYETSLGDMEELSRPIVLALIEKRLSQMLNNVDGVIKKYEKDKYIILFPQESLISLEELKFSILDEIKEIKMGNKSTITLSIGLGYNSDDLAEVSDRAMASMDLALGRGGDQVVLNDGKDFRFFGGTGIEKIDNTRVKSRIKAEILSNLIVKHKNVLIMGHKYSDVDSLGSCIGMHAIVKSVNPIVECNIVLGNVSTSISKLYNQLIKEGYEEKFIDRDTAKKICEKDTLVIALDTYIRGKVECEELLDIAKNVVVIDHHRKSTDYIKDTKLVYHDPNASSTAELVTELIMYTKHISKIKKIEATSLLTGIIVDTKNFASKTSSKTFEAAAYLKNKGADTQIIRTILQNSIDNYRHKSQTINSAEIYENYAGFGEVVGEVQNPSLIISQSADELLYIDGIEVSFVLYDLGETILVSARSLGTINVQTIMETLGGGGHGSIAAAQVKDKTKEEIIKHIKEQLDLLKEE